MQALRPVLLASLPMLFVACGGDGAQDVTLSFEARVGSEIAACGQQFMLGSQDTMSELTDFRFYVSNVRLVDSAGNETPISLTQSVWQHQDVALLDFEDATGACDAFGTADTNNVVVGTVPGGNYTGVRFAVGVPFELNHLDATTAPSPLNINAMQWNWQAGYKHIRVDTTNTSTAWNLHIGSTGCTSGSTTEPPATPCTRPNRMEVSMEGFDPDTNIIVVDLESVLADSDVSFNTPMTPPGCMSFPTNAENCAEVFPRMGMDFDTGGCVGACSGQQFFSME